MTKFYIILAFVFLINFYPYRSIAQTSENISFTINGNVQNRNKDYFKEIYQLWKNYLNSYRYYLKNESVWDYSEYKTPDYSYIDILNKLKSWNRNNETIHCNILGIVPVENGFYLLKSVFIAIDSTNSPDIKYITNVYVKKGLEGFRLFNSVQYHKTVLNKTKIGNIIYYYPNDHKFDKIKAQKLDEFNRNMAQKFNTEAITFDYFIARDIEQLNQILGFDLRLNSYNANPAKGAIADILNNVLIIGDDSEYYPHEVVHLYNYKLFPRKYHYLIDEGIAALFGGSVGYKLEWHLQKFKTFLLENPDFTFHRLSELEQALPYDRINTKLIYLVGGLICKKVFEKEGMPGLIELLQAGKTDKDFYNIVLTKFDINEKMFPKFILDQIKNLKDLDEEQMRELKL